MWLSAGRERRAPGHATTVAFPLVREERGYEPEKKSRRRPKAYSTRLVCACLSLWSRPLPSAFQPQCDSFTASIAACLLYFPKSSFVLSLNWSVKLFLDALSRTAVPVTRSCCSAACSDDLPQGRSPAGRTALPIITYCFLTREPSSLSRQTENSPFFANTGKNPRSRR